jgi:beta-lactam-binding protein with PASTA domain
VPKVVGKSLSKARKAIRSHRCKVGRVRHKWSRKLTKNKVISQRPRAGRVLRHNGHVSLVVSIGKCHDDGDHDLDDRCPPITEHNGP